MRSTERDLKDSNRSLSKVMKNVYSLCRQPLGSKAELKKLDQALQPQAEQLRTQLNILSTHLLKYDFRRGSDAVEAREPESQLERDNFKDAGCDYKGESVTKERSKANIIAQCLSPDDIVDQCRANDSNEIFSTKMKSIAIFADELLRTMDSSGMTRTVYNALLDGLTRSIDDKLEQDEDFAVHYHDNFLLNYYKFLEEASTVLTTIHFLHTAVQRDLECDHAVNIWREAIVNHAKPDSTFMSLRPRIYSAVLADLNDKEKTSHSHLRWLRYLNPMLWWRKAKEMIVNPKPVMQLPERCVDPAHIYNGRNQTPDDVYIVPTDERFHKLTINECRAMDARELFLLYFAEYHKSQAASLLVSQINQPRNEDVFTKLMSTDTSTCLIAEVIGLEKGLYDDSFLTGNFESTQQGVSYRAIVDFYTKATSVQKEKLLEQPQRLLEMLAYCYHVKQHTDQTETEDRRLVNRVWSDQSFHAAIRSSQSYKTETQQDLLAALRHLHARVAPPFNPAPPECNVMALAKPKNTKHWLASSVVGLVVTFAAAHMATVAATAMVAFFKWHMLHPLFTKIGIDAGAAAVGVASAKRLAPKKAKSGVLSFFYNKNQPACAIETKADDSMPAQP